MEYEVKAPFEVKDGAHQGVIQSIEYRTEPYKYTDVLISIGEDIVLKYGCPSVVSNDSKLGKLLKAFGATLKPGEKVEDKKYLIGKKCVLMTLTEEKGDKKYSRIVDGSVKPLDEPEVEEV